MAKGTLYVCGIKDLSNYKYIHHKFFIVRFLKKKDKAVLDKYGFMHIPDLSPSKELVKGYLELKEKGNWGKDKFNSWYKPLFIKEMYSRHLKMRDWLNYIYKLLNNGEDVVLACYCYDAYLCHRSLVAEEFGNLGFDIMVK